MNVEEEEELDVEEEEELEKLVEEQEAHEAVKKYEAEELEKLVEEQEAHEAVKKYEAELEVIGIQIDTIKENINAVDASTKSSRSISYNMSCLDNKLSNDVKVVNDERDMESERADLNHETTLFGYDARIERARQEISHCEAAKNSSREERDARIKIVNDECGAKIKSLNEKYKLAWGALKAEHDEMRLREEIPHSKEYYRKRSNDAQDTDLYHLYNEYDATCSQLEDAQNLKRRNTSELSM